MKPEIQLIQLFLWGCTVYDKHPALKYQRWNRNTTEPLFTDQEVLTIYLFGHLQERFKLKAIHREIQQHWSTWFPHLPSYQAFNHRLNLLEAVWPVLLGELMAQMEMPRAVCETDQMLDSLPLMLAVRGRSTKAKVALDQADKGYCESKKLWYHEGKLLLLGAKQYHRLPVPLSLCLTEASRHDLPVSKEAVLSESSVVFARMIHEIAVFIGRAQPFLKKLLHIHLVPLPDTLFGDKDYLDQATKQSLAAQGTTICTPDKKKKGRQSITSAKAGYGRVAFPPCASQSSQSSIGWCRKPVFKMLQGSFQ